MDKVLLLILTVLGAFALAVLSAGIGGAVFMIVLGILHSVNPLFPALGFDECFLIVLLVKIATSESGSFSVNK